MTDKKLIISEGQTGCDRAVVDIDERLKRKINERLKRKINERLKRKIDERLKRKIDED